LNEKEIFSGFGPLLIIRGMIIIFMFILNWEGRDIFRIWAFYLLGIRVRCLFRSGYFKSISGV
jgi:hypothetical protein